MNPERGQFRGVEMDDIDQWADNPIWDDEQTKGRYRIPLGLSRNEARRQGKLLRSGIPENELYKTAHYICAVSPLTHRAAFKHAIDFLVLDGNEVFAAADGTVMEVQENSNEWGDDVRFRDALNYLTIEHYGGEFSQYCHLARNSVGKARVYIGTKVRQGQVIAKVGKT